MESGLIETWRHLVWSRFRIKGMRKYGEQVYKKYYAQINSGIEFKPEFDELGLVSLEALKYAFALCGTILCASVLIYVVEWSVEIVKIFETVKAIVCDFLTREVESFRNICIKIWGFL